MVRGSHGTTVVRAGFLLRSVGGQTYCTLTLRRTRAMAGLVGKNVATQRSVLSRGSDRTPCGKRMSAHGRQHHAENRCNGRELRSIRPANAKHVTRAQIDQIAAEGQGDHDQRHHDWNKNQHPGQECRGRCPGGYDNGSGCVPSASIEGRQYGDGHCQGHGCGDIQPPGHEDIQNRARVCRHSAQDPSAQSPSKCRNHRTQSNVSNGGSYATGP